MLIRLDQTRSEPFQWNEHQSIDPAALDRSELLELSPVEWSGELRFAPPGYRLTAEVSYQQTLTCTRCLTPKTIAVREPIEFLIVVESEAEGARDHELSERDLGLVVVDDEEIDLQPILLENIQLNIPMRVVCRDDCRGLCPHCGKNLNTDACDCAPPTDPRWGALAALRDELDS